MLWGATRGAAERGAGECVFLVYPLTQKQAVQPGRAELGAIVMSVYGGFQKNFLSWISCSRCSHLEKWCIISLWTRIWQSRVLCLGVACGVLKIGFFGRNAWIDSGYIFLRWSGLGS